MTALGVIVFVVALIVSVMLHEYGHMATARRFGCKVTEYFVGFGPRLWSFRRGETEYGVKALPAGGYVRIVGMTDLEEVDPADEPRAFYRRPTGQRLIVLSAGSAMHFIIGFVLLVVIALGFGHNSADPAPRVGIVETCVPPVNGSCPATNPPPSPALAAGLKSGDVITSINGTQITSWTQMTNILHSAKPGAQLALTYTRDGVSHSVNVSPVVGQTTDANGNSVNVSLIGIGENTLTSHPGFLGSFRQGADDFGTLAWGSLKGIGSIPAAIPKLFHSTVDHSARDVNGPVGVVGAAQVSGNVFGDRDYAGFFSLVAALNIFIGLINLFPLLPLDGGHIAIALFEAARRRIYRIVGRKDPGRVDLNKLIPIAYGFIIVLAGLSLLLLAADITNPIRLSG